MKKKGFTLVELLAVIVILAIIALIATPMILNVIENAKKGASKSSALGYIEGIEKYIALNEVTNKNSFNFEKGFGYKIEDIKNIIEIKGDKPTEGWIRLNNGTVDDYELKIGNYIVRNKEGKAVSEKGNYYLNGTAIYFNPVTGEKCNDYQEENSKYLVKEGCMKWYIFNDSESSGTVNMILDHSINTDNVPWNSSGDNTDGMNEVEIQLQQDTATWDSNLNARLITADEVAKITEADKVLSWSSDKSYVDNPIIGTNISLFYFDGKYWKDSTWRTQVVSGDGASRYAWLFDNNNESNRNGGNTSDSYEGRCGMMWGYWTSTAVNGVKSKAWVVHSSGSLETYIVNGGCAFGVRPVITISKSLLD